MNLLVGGSERRSSLKLVEDKRFSSPCKDFPPEVTIPTALNGVQILVNPEEIKGSPGIGPTQQVFDLLVGMNTLFLLALAPWATNLLTTYGMVEPILR